MWGCRLNSAARILIFHNLKPSAFGFCVDTVEGLWQDGQKELRLWGKTRHAYTYDTRNAWPFFVPYLVF